MITQFNLKDAPEGERPSRSQLTRLLAGDNVLLSFKDDGFWVKLLSRIDDDMIGVVLGVIAHGSIYYSAVPTEEINVGDKITFELKHVHQVRPDKDRLSLPMHMLLVPFEGANIPYVFRTKWPRVIATIHLGEWVTATAAVWIDQIVDFSEEQKTLAAIVDWYFYNYVNKKK